MKMKWILPGLASAVIALASAGCGIFSIEPDQTVVFYDLGAGKGSRQSPVIVEEFRNDSPYQSKLAFRTAANSIRFDEFKRWTADPSELVRTAFMSAISDTDIKTACNVRGEILVFECDIENKAAVFTADVEILKDTRQVWHGTVSETVPVTGNLTGTSFAAAMSRAVSKAAADISARIKISVQ